MNFEDMPNSAYAAYLQSKKAEEERKSNDQYKNSIMNATNAVEEQSIIAFTMIGIFLINKPILYESLRI